MVKLQKYDFKRYRNWFCLIHVLRQFCKYEGNEMKGRAVCPYLDCRVKRSYTIKWRQPFRVAHCLACHRTMDALAVVVASCGGTLYDACDQLQLLGEDY